MRKLICGLLFFVLCLCRMPVTQASELPYESYAYGTDRQPYYIQSLYAPVEIIGQNLYVDNHDEMTVVKGLANPSDIFIDDNNFLYVCDRDNHRVVKIDAKGTLYQTFGVSEDSAQCIKTPEGVFVTENGDVYVADSGSACIQVFDQSGAMLRNISAPDDVRLRNIMFVPVNVAVDVRGFIYVVLKGGNEGLLALNPKGVFQGFVGRNKTELSIGERIKRIFFTEEQVRTSSNKVAASVSGVAIGQDGYIYTCTRNVKEGQIKKFNARGEDLFLNKNMQMLIPNTLDKPIDSSVAALCVAANGMIYAVDRNNGMVLIYDSNGAVITVFGAKLTNNDRRIGVFSEPCGIAVGQDGMLYVLDRNYNGIHVFKPTPFMKNIMQATELYNDGQYLEAQPLWNNILKSNVNVFKANLGLGKIAYVNKDWNESMRQMKIAYNQQYYSDALWQYRAQWVQKNASAILLAVMILALLQFVSVKIFRFHAFRQLHKGLSYLNQKLVLPWLSKVPFVLPVLSQTRYSLRVLRHPVDTYYEAVHRAKSSIASAICVYILFVIAMILNKVLTNFCFNLTGIRGVTIQSVVLSNFLPIFIWIIANYLVGAISKGQGTFKAVFITGIYALMPLIVFMVPLSLLSNMLTLAEEPIYRICQFVLYGWTAFLLFMQVKEVQGYEVTETIKRILWILFTAAMIIFCCLAIFGIVNQSFNFVNEFTRELIGYV